MSNKKRGIVSTSTSNTLENIEFSSSTEEEEYKYKKKKLPLKKRSSSVKETKPNKKKKISTKQDSYIKSQEALTFKNWVEKEVRPFTAIRVCDFIFTKNMWNNDDIFCSYTISNRLQAWEFIEKARVTGIYDNAKYATNGDLKEYVLANITDAKTVKTMQIMDEHLEDFLRTEGFESKQFEIHPLIRSLEYDNRNGEEIKKLNMCKIHLAKSPFPTVFRNSKFEELPYEDRHNYLPKGETKEVGIVVKCTQVWCLPMKNDRARYGYKLEARDIIIY